MNVANETAPLVLDRKELTERMMGNIQIAQRMVRQFLNSSPEEIDLLEATIRMGHAADVASLAHRHKGTARTLAAPRVGEVAYCIEHAARDGNLADLLAQVDALNAAHEDLKIAVDQWVADTEQEASP